MSLRPICSLGFDQVYLDMVEMIVTEQDRKDVILELEVFIVSGNSILHSLTIDPEDSSRTKSTINLTRCPTPS